MPQTRVDYRQGRGKLTTQKVLEDVAFPFPRCCWYAESSPFCSFSTAGTLQKPNPPCEFFFFFFFANQHILQHHFLPLAGREVSGVTIRLWWHLVGIVRRNSWNLCCWSSGFGQCLRGIVSTLKQLQAVVCRLRWENMHQILCRCQTKGTSSRKGSVWSCTSGINSQNRVETVHPVQITSEIILMTKNEKKKKLFCSSSYSLGCNQGTSSALLLAFLHQRNPSKALSSHFQRWCWKASQIIYFPL